MFSDFMWKKKFAPGNGAGGETGALNTLLDSD